MVSWNSKHTRAVTFGKFKIFDACVDSVLKFSLHSENARYTNSLYSVNYSLCIVNIFSVYSEYSFSTVNIFSLCSENMRHTNSLYTVNILFAQWIYSPYIVNIFSLYSEYFLSIVRILNSLAIVNIPDSLIQWTYWEGLTLKDFLSFLCLRHPCLNPKP